MNPIDPSLEALLRGELSAEEERRLRARAVADPALAGEIAAYDRTRRALGELPTEMEPPRDLFPRIAARLEPREQRARRWALPAAAGLLLIASLVLLARLQGLGSETDSRPPAAAGPGSSTIARSMPGASTIARSAYGETDRALADIRRELRRTIEARKDTLPPETRELVFENLRVIDQAITDIEGALAAAPGDAQLARTYIAYRERQIALLQQVNRMAAKL